MNIALNCSTVQHFSSSRQLRTWQEAKASKGVYACANLLDKNCSLVLPFVRSHLLTWSVHELWCALHAGPVDPLWGMRHINNPKPDQRRTALDWETKSKKCFPNEIDAPATATQSVSDAVLWYGPTYWVWLVELQDPVLQHLLSQKKFSRDSAWSSDFIPSEQKHHRTVRQSRKLDTCMGLEFSIGLLQTAFLPFSSQPEH